MEQTKWEIRIRGQEIWHGMLDDIAAAKQSIEMEQFSVRDDKIGHIFLQYFERKLKQGVKVRIICDAMNSWRMFASPYFKQLTRQGLESIAFNPLNIFKPTKAFFRAHKKTLIVDSKVAWVGGLGIKDKFENFRDNQIRLEGPVVADIIQSFEAVWQNPDPEAKLPITPQPKDKEFQYLINSNGYHKKQIYEWMRDSIAKAKKHIYLTSSYFYPDQNFFQLMINKAQQGVDVKIIIRGKDDEHLPVRFSASYFRPALINGIGIYRYMPNIIHAKGAIIDDVASIGTCNLDKFSFFYNSESNIVSRNKLFVQEINRQFHEDLKFCSHITLEAWEQRPLRERALELVLWPFHNYL